MSVLNINLLYEYKLYNNPLYFYHLLPDNVVGDELLSPYAMVKNGLDDLAIHSTDKYRERLVDSWNIYPNKNPEDLTIDEILYGLRKFRGENGDKMIYFFRYPPYKELGKNMNRILQGKVLYRIDINDPKIIKYIKEIFWGYENSHSDNAILNREYYENITKEEYFSKYDDEKSPIFATLSHISIAFKDGKIPLKYLEKIKIPKTYKEV